MKHNVTGLEEDSESVDYVLGNYLTDPKLRHHTSREVSSMIDTQPELLQLPQAERDECRIVDMCSIAKIEQLYHG